MKTSTIPSYKCDCQCHHLEETKSYYHIDELQSTIGALKKKVDKLQNENSELKKLNKNLNSKINLLINENDIVKNVKIDIQDYSDYTHFHSEDTLKEFFYLLVLSEKMKYLNLDHIWMIDSAVLYKEVLNLDLAFYEWTSYLSRKLKEENDNFMKKTKLVSHSSRENGIIAKLKSLWYDSSLTFFNKIRNLNYKSQNGTQICPKMSLYNNSSSSLSKKAQTHSTNLSSGGNNNSHSSSDLIKTKYLEMLKIKHNNPVNKANRGISGKYIVLENEIEQLLMENENSFNEENNHNNYENSNSYNSFLN